MHARSRATGVLLLATVALAGCAANPAPQGWLPRPEDVAIGTRGAWVVVHRKPEISGELIAVADEAIYVLTDDGLRTVARADIKRATLAIHEPGPGAGGWPVLTLTNGWFLVFTLPMWAVAEVVEKESPYLRLPRHRLEEYRKYARFPQGLPPDLDPARLGRLSRAGALSHPGSR